MSREDQFIKYIKYVQWVEYPNTKLAYLINACHLHWTIRRWSTVVYLVHDFLTYRIIYNLVLDNKTSHGCLHAHVIMST